MENCASKQTPLVVGIWNELPEEVLEAFELLQMGHLGQHEQVGRKGPFPYFHVKCVLDRLKTTLTQIGDSN